MHDQDTINENFCLLLNCMVQATQKTHYSNREMYELLCIVTL